MADLGFSGVFEKFEEHWGKRSGRWLSLIIGLWVAAVCVGAIWQWIISPVLSFLGSPKRSSTIWSLALAIFAIGVGISISAALSEALIRWKRVKQMRDLLDETQRDHENMMSEHRRIMGESQETVTHAMEVFDNARDTHLKTRVMLAATILMMRSAVEANKTLSDEQRAEEFARIREAQDAFVASSSNEGEQITGNSDERFDALLNTMAPVQKPEKME